MLSCYYGSFFFFFFSSRRRHTRLQGDWSSDVCSSDLSLATRLGRRPLQWAELTGLDWVLGQRRTPMREQITDFFLRAGVEPPPPFVETLSAKVIGELVAANERAVSIVPADIRSEEHTSE